MSHEIQDHFLVFGQFFGIAVCCYPAGQIDKEDYFYLIISALGIIIGITTIFFNKIGNFNIYPQIKPKAKFITSGPYSLVRHPMYLSLTLMMLGITLFNFHYQTLAGLTLIVIVISKKALKEEKLLIEKFPEYRAYISRTKRVIPWTW